MTPEQKQRLERLQKRAKNRHSSVRPPEWADIDFLLSLVKEQEAEIGELQSQLEQVTKERNALSLALKEEIERPLK